MRKLINGGLLVLVMLISLATTISCGCTTKDSAGLEYMPDMYTSPAVEAYDAAVINTAPYTKENLEENLDQVNPLQLSLEHLTNGEKMYNIMCSACHGMKGLGDGAVVEKGGHARPPAFNTGLKDLSSVQMYNTIVTGKGMMGSYASQVNKEERWQIVLYLETLQEV